MREFDQVCDVCFVFLSKPSPEWSFVPAYSCLIGYLIRFCARKTPHSFERRVGWDDIRRAHTSFLSPFLFLPSRSWERVLAHSRMYCDGNFVEECCRTEERQIARTLVGGKRGMFMFRTTEDEASPDVAMIFTGRFVVCSPPPPVVSFSKYRVVARMPLRESCHVKNGRCPRGSPNGGVVSVVSRARATI